MTEVEAFIRQTAMELGIDPDVAVTVARSEGGLNDPFRRALGVNKTGMQEPAYGPLQMLIGGPGTGYPEGLGNRALAAGIDPRTDWQGATRFGLERAKDEGWGAWYGAAKAGIDRREGLGGPMAKQYALDTAAPPDGPKGEEMYPKPAPPLPPPYSIADRPIAGMQVAGITKPKPKGGKLAGKIGEALAGFGTTAFGGGGGSAGPRGAMPSPGAARLDAPGEQPTIDPQQAEMQRQQLAMALARLNTGRLF